MRTAIIGTGVIGAAWAAGFLAAGHEVTAYDPAPGAADRLRDDVRSALETTHPEVLGRLAQLNFSGSLAEAVGEADFVQENGPERLEVKQAILADIDAAAPDSAIIASSTSGFGPSAIAASAEVAPQRIVVGHPFNPAHLIPLVEVVTARGAPEEIGERAVEVYRAIGKKPIRLRAELPGHVVNRLQAALWQEAYSLIDRGVVSVEDIDTAISYGPGLRWAVLGPLAIQHLSGGPGGMRHLLEHLGPPQEVWMHDLRQVHLGEELTEKLVTGVEEELDGRSTAALIRDRDAMLAELIALKERYPTLP
ncbi:MULTISPECIES: 3-hydroxyacyl-CoA dehydrogenase NAD-binding domain-containing protein [Brevibacterium]|uniref:NAD(P)-binding domain-containing protein n=1 Tax=Brevibacterium casei TaxID=33889 RepID=A0A7T3ZZQ1_9MICO|nr:3-hydroxyacyl-CoA dehydrogenase NAD-binding domain-containing protein [Brevibacterium casei]QQB14613.1 NAD(P)-binding domain-containing protein [Brevibacterium casei]